MSVYRPIDTATARIPENFSGRDEAERSVRSGDNVVWGQFETVHPVPESFVELDDLISDLSGDPEVAEAFAEGRKWGARKFYKGELSLRTLRLQRGLSQKQLAKIVGSSQSHIAKLESGQADPQFTTLQRLANALGVKVSRLAGVIAGEAD